MPNETKNISTKTSNIYEHNYQNSWNKVAVLPCSNQGDLRILAKSQTEDSNLKNVQPTFRISYVQEVNIPWEDRSSHDDIPTRSFLVLPSLSATENAKGEPPSAWKVKHDGLRMEAKRHQDDMFGVWWSSPCVFQGGGWWYLTMDLLCWPRCMAHFPTETIFVAR